MTHGTQNEIADVERRIRTVESVLIVLSIAAIAAADRFVAPSASLAAARAAGGKVVMGPREIPGGDRIAEVLDPQGAPFALHQPKG